MKLNIIKCSTFILIGLPFYFIAISSSGGITGVSQGGCTCHGSQSANTTVTISPTLTSYTAGEKVNFTITVANPNMVTGTSGGGFNLQTNIGTLTSLDAETQVIGNELTHTMRKPSSTGSVSWTFRWSAPTAGNTPLQMTLAGNAVDGTGSTNNDEWNFANIPSVPLPVTFTHVNGNYTRNGVELEWHIEDMVNASHFEVERSLDGYYFYTIGTINIVNKNKIYHYFDPNSLAGGNSYRIKAIDYDGQVTMSDIIFVSQSKQKEFKVYPSVITDGKLMVSSSETDAALNLQIFNHNGALVMSQQLFSNSVDVSSLSTGMYIVKALEGSHILATNRIVIN